MYSREKAFQNAVMISKVIYKVGQLGIMIVF